MRPKRDPLNQRRAVLQPEDLHWVLRRDNRAGQAVLTRNKCTWLPACFVHDDQVGDVVGPAGLDQRWDLVVPSVHALSTRKHQLHLLRQQHEA